MDNTIIPYEEVSDISSDEIDSSDDNEAHNHILSNNIGVNYNNFNNQDNFMDMENTEDYETMRNKYFTPEISKTRLLIDSKNVDHTSTHSTSNYTIYFDKTSNENENETNTKTNNDNCNVIGTFNNVIGFKLIKAIVHNSIYTVNNNNKNIIITVDHRLPPDVDIPNLVDFSINLTPNSYTFKELGDHLAFTINSIDSLSGFGVHSDKQTLKYQISTIHGGSGQFKIKWKDSIGSAYRLFGFRNINTENLNTTFTSDDVVQQNTHFVDLVIPEIPYIACKKNINGTKIIDRIPLNENKGSMVYYSTDINLSNYFYPINIDRINIQIHEDTIDTFYDCQNNDNFFEFEITTLNK